MGDLALPGHSWLLLFSLTCLPLVNGHFWPLKKFLKTRPHVTYTVTLNVYSGRPDPYWIIDASNRNYRILADAIDNCSSTRIDSHLGYRGFSVELRNMYGQVLRKTVGSRTNSKLEELLLNSFAAISRSLKHYVNLAIRSKKKLDFRSMYNEYNPWAPYHGFHGRRKKRHGFPPMVAPPPMCKPRKFDPYNWNYFPVVLHNNCYNYATGIQTGTMAQPGYGSGFRYKRTKTASLLPSSMLAASIRDGLIYLPSHDQTALPNSGHLCLLALVVWPGNDFHLYRLDSNSYWSQKIGRTPANTVDNSGRGILDPRNSDRGPYTTFVAFMGSTGDVLIA